MFVPFIRPHLSQSLNKSRFGPILAEAIEEIRKGRQRRNVDAHTFPQALFSGSKGLSRTAHSRQLGPSGTR